MKLHGLRMLEAEVFTRFSFASADSATWRAISVWTSAGRRLVINQPIMLRGVVIADRIEAVNSAPRWNGQALQNALEFGETASLFDAAHP